jgi:hypothetical protein
MLNSGTVFSRLMKKSPATRSVSYPLSVIGDFAIGRR